MSSRKPLWGIALKFINVKLLSFYFFFKEYICYIKARYIYNHQEELEIKSVKKFKDDFVQVKTCPVGSVLSFFWVRSLFPHLQQEWAISFSNKKDSILDEVLSFWPRITFPYFTAIHLMLNTKRLNKAFPFPCFLLMKLTLCFEVPHSVKLCLFSIMDVLS